MSTLRMPRRMAPEASDGASVVAHVQHRRGLPATEGCYQAWRGLDERDWEIRPFEHAHEIAADPEHPVIGGIHNVVAGLAQLGVAPPDIDYPTPLRPFLLDPDVEVLSRSC